MSGGNGPSGWVLGHREVWSPGNRRWLFPKVLKKPAFLSYGY